MILLNVSQSMVYEILVPENDPYEKGSVMKISEEPYSIQWVQKTEKYRINLFLNSMLVTVSNYRLKCFSSISRNISEAAVLKLKQRIQSIIWKKHNKEYEMPQNFMNTKKYSIYCKISSSYVSKLLRLL